MYVQACQDAVRVPYAVDDPVYCRIQRAFGRCYPCEALKFAMFQTVLVQEYTASLSHVLMTIDAMLQQRAAKPSVAACAWQ